GPDNLLVFASQDKEVGPRRRILLHRFVDEDQAILWIVQRDAVIGSVDRVGQQRGEAARALLADPHRFLGGLALGEVTNGDADEIPIVRANRAYADLDRNFGVVLAQQG